MELLVQPEPSHQLAFDVERRGLKTRFKVESKERRAPLEVELNLPGRHNVLNSLAVIAVAAELGIAESGLDRVIHLSYRLLGLISFLTAGPDEVRAWPIPDGSSAVDAAGAIHSDLARGFIRAETVSYADFVAHDGWKGAREKGVVRAEGKEYVVQDGDVLLFRFNV